MAFRKRNAPITSSGNAPGTSNIDQTPPPGIRPSPLTAASVTSTGTAELDSILGGHGGLALGSSLLIGEHGTTDYAGALLRAYTAEGLLQGHEVHLIGMDKSWIHNLPGVADESKSKQERSSTESEKMKIAWRYENQGRPGERVPVSRPIPSFSSTDDQSKPFCHSFDLTKRLEASPDHKVTYYPLAPGSSPLITILQRLVSSLSSRPSSIHRIVIPSFLSPAYYPPITNSDQILQFMHGLNALLQKHHDRLTLMTSLPLSLYPRTTGLVRWIKHFSSGVVELLPFPYLSGDDTPASGKEKAQGLLRISKLPLVTERGEGGAGSGNTIGDDLAFTLSRKKFVIEPFSLPPMEGDQEAQKEAGKTTAKDIEF